MGTLSDKPLLKKLAARHSTQLAEPNPNNNKLFKIINLLLLEAAIMPWCLSVKSF